MATPHALGIPASVSSFGISFVERSEDLVSERDFLVTALQVLQHIYDTRDNRSEIVTNWVWDLDPPSSTPLNISAVGRGLEEGLPITFTNSAMVLFVRWLGQISRAHKWETFRCHYGWREGGKKRNDIVAIGNYTPFNPTAPPPRLEQPVLS